MQQHKYNNERGILTTLHQTPENDWDRRISSSYILLGSSQGNEVDKNSRKFHY